MPSPNSPPTSVSREIVNATSPAPGLQKQPVRSEIECRVATRSTKRSSTMRPSGWRKLNATVAPRRSASRGPYTVAAGAPFAVPQPAEHLEQGGAERLDVRVDRVDPDPLEVAQADLDRRQGEEVHRPVLEVRRARGRLVPLALHERGHDRAAREPGPLEHGERLAAGERARRHRSASRTSCRTTPARSPGGRPRGRAGSSARTRPRRRARASRARAPARSRPAGGGRRRSSTAPGRRTGCGARPRPRRGSAPSSSSSTRSSGATLGT